MKNRITYLLTAVTALALLVNQATAGTTWNGNNTTGNWGTASSWEGAVPTFAATTDLLFRNFSANNRTVGVLNSDRTVRSLTFNVNVTNGFEIRLNVPNNNAAKNLTMGDGSNPATITVNSGAVGNIVVGKGTGAVVGNLILSNNLAVVQNSTSATLTLDGPITENPGPYSLTKTGTGRLTLAGTSTYSGSTIINVGSLVCQVGGSCANSAVSVAATSGNTATLGITNNDNTKSWTFASLTVDNTAGTSSDLNFDFISVSPSATVAPLVITGAATYTTTPSVTVALGAGSVIAAGNSYPLYTRASFSGTEPTAVTVTQPGSTITAHLAVTGTTNYLVIDTYASPQPLRWAVSGAGTWDTSSINWTNNFGTPTAFTSGDQVRFDETYITAPTTVTLDTVVTPVSVTVSNVTHNYTISGSGAITGAIPLTKAGAAKLTLTTTNTYSGTTTITAGTLELGDGTSGHDGTIGNSASVVNSGTLAFNRAGSNNYAGVISGSGTVTKLGADTQSLSVANTYTGDTTINDGILQGNAVNSFGASTNTRTITVNTGGTLYFNVAGLFGGHFSTNVPTLVINAGGTAVNTKINGNNPLNNLTLNGGVLTSTSGQSTWGAWNINGTVTATGNSTITNSGGANQETLLASGTGATTTTMNVVNASDLLTITTSLLNGRDTASPYTAHATGLTKTGAGALTLTGTNTYTGTTTVSNGVLQLTSATATGLATNSSVKLFTASGSLDLNFTGTNQVAALYIDGVAQPNGVYGAAGTHITGTGYLKVVAITPPTLTMTNLGGGQLQFSWTGSGNLQAQTNSLSVGLGTNWVDYPGASPVTITINPANGSVFYRVKQ